MSQFPLDRPFYAPVPKRRTGLSHSADAATIDRLQKDNQRLTQQVKQLTQALKALQPKLPAMADDGIPEVFELELMRGRKLARLFRQGDSVQFMGVGMNGVYDVEGYAECLMKKTHEVPDPGCSCGFYIPAKLDNHYGDPRQHWVLDVEFGGKVLDCGMGALPVPARGYKASWQRVLSVTAPTMCRQCSADAEYVCVQLSNNIEALCPKHASVAPSTQEKPLTWVREHLATELVAPNLTDASPPEPAVPSLPAWEEEYLRSRQPVPLTPAWPAIQPGTTWTGTWTGTYTLPTYITGSSTTATGPITWTQNT